MQKVIMFNGPPRAGKDTAGLICQDLFGKDVKLVKFTEAVKDQAHFDLGISCDALHYEVLKDTPLPEFQGKTPREVYIQTSERLKAEHGPHVVARLLIESLKDAEEMLIVNTDVGYDFEAQHLIDLVGAENTVLVRLHREGKTFDDDCRNWVHMPGIESYDVQNEDFLGLREAIEKITAVNVREAAMSF